MNTFPTCWRPLGSISSPTKRTLQVAEVNTFKSQWKGTDREECGCQWRDPLFTREEDLCPDRPTQWAGAWGHQYQPWGEQVWEQGCDVYVEDGTDCWPCPKSSQTMTHPIVSKMNIVSPCGACSGFGSVCTKVIEQQNSQAPALWGLQASEAGWQESRGGRGVLCHS